MSNESTTREVYLLDVIRQCAETFRRYEKLHLAKIEKVRPESDLIPIVKEKAAENAKMAELCERALKP